MIKNIISAFLTRGLVAAINLAVLLISSKQLGADIVGQVGRFVLNITIIQIINEIYTGYSLVYFIAKFPLKKIYVTGLLWTGGCIFLLTLIFILLNFIFIRFNIGTPISKFEGSLSTKKLWLHVGLLSLMCTLNSFHCVILLAKEKIKSYNFLVFLQPTILLLALCLNIFVLDAKTFNGYISAMYYSFLLALLASAFLVIKLFRKEKNDVITTPYFKAILKNGFINQAGNLAHTLSNRVNFYLLSSMVLIGVFSRASSLIESVWLVGASITPLVLTRIANQQDDAHNSRLVFLLSKVSLIVSIFCVVIILCLPGRFFVFLLGPDFYEVKTLMLYLSPGILFIGFSTVLSHYFSGVGEQKVQLLANCLGLLVTLCTAAPFIARYQIAGACYAASLSYFVQALAVTVIFMRRKDFKFSSLLSFKKDLDLLKR